MTESVDPGSSGNINPNIGTSSHPLTSGNQDVRRASLHTAGYSDTQIDAILSMANPDDQGNSLTPTHFYSVNKATLNALQYTGQLDPASQQLVYLQAPVSMVQEVSNPANWQGDNYIGPGASSINSYLLGEPVDFSRPSLDALVMSVLTARAEIIEVQLRDQITSIQEKNAQLEEANTWLTRAKGQKADAGSSGTSRFDREYDGVSFEEYWGRMNAERQDNLAHNSADWDVNIEGLKAKIEALTSQSQLETTKLQQTINKYNQSFEMLSNFINKYYQSLSTLIQNLR